MSVFSDLDQRSDRSIGGPERVFLRRNELRSLSTIASFERKRPLCEYKEEECERTEPPPDNAGSGLRRKNRERKRYAPLHKHYAVVRERYEPDRERKKSKRERRKVACERQAVKCECWTPERERREPRCGENPVERGRGTPLRCVRFPDSRVAKFARSVCAVVRNVRVPLFSVATPGR